MSVGLFLLAFGVLLLPPRRTWPGAAAGGRGGRGGGAGRDGGSSGAGRHGGSSGSSGVGRHGGSSGSSGGGGRRFGRRRASAAAARSLPGVLDLVAVALRSGAAPGPALVAAAAAADPELRALLRDIGGQLALGVDPAGAWAPARASPELAAVAVLAERSGTSGARLAETFAAVAATLRDDALADGRRAAARVGVWSVLPLGLCFLPAFVCLGVVPAVVGLLGGLDTPLR